MSNRYVVTAIGADRPGLTQALAGAVLAAGGNWLEGHLARLGGQFVGAVEIECAPDAAELLRVRLADLERDGLSVALVPATIEPAADQPIALDMVGQDRPGLVHEVSAVLARLRVNIAELETSREASAWSGAPLFRARLRLTLPDELDERDLRAALEALSGDMMIDAAEAPL